MCREPYSPSSTCPTTSHPGSDPKSRAPAMSVGGKRSSAMRNQILARPPVPVVLDRVSDVYSAAYPRREDQAKGKTSISPQFAIRLCLNADVDVAISRNSRIVSTALNTSLRLRAHSHTKTSAAYSTIAHVRARLAMTQTKSDPFPVYQAIISMFLDASPHGVLNHGRFSL